MTIQEIISKAIFIQFPKNRLSYHEYNIDNVHKLPLPGDMMYYTWPLNNNHFTTEYHRKYVLPLLNELFNMNYNESDFHLVERHYNEHDISMLYPNKEYSFDVYSLEFDEKHYNVPFDILVNSCNINHYSITEYHKLYKYPHSSSHIINNTIDSDRKLIVSGDSQMIPIISIIACYFKEVIYLDNGSQKSLKQYIEEFNPTDVLIELNADVVSHYLERNFK